MTDKPLAAGWPRLSYEEYAWRPDENRPMPRAQRRRQGGVYAAAIAPEIAPVEVVPLPAAVSALADEASAEIARFDAEIGSEVAPFTALLLRSESASSSKIENLTASAKAIGLAELGDSGRQNAAVIVANTRAMEAAIALSDDIGTQAILDMHEVLLRDTRPEWAGRWRTSQVWIGGSDYGPIGAMFVPPHHTRIPAAMEDLVRFLRRDDVPAFISAVVGHAQFETIHPFPDGNGRTGRALLQATLRSKRLTRNVTVPLSAGLLVDTDRYFDALMSYREGDVGTLVEMMSNAAFLAIDNGRQLVEQLRQIRESWTGLIRMRRGSAAWRLADHLVRQPVIDSPLVQRELDVAAPNVNAAINHLAEIGVLRKISGNARNRRWAAFEVLDALDAFAARAGRRGG